MLVALAIFLLHNVIDFSLFEAGPMMLFAFLTGSVLGVRQPSVAGRRKNTAAAAVALLVCVVLWIAAAGFVWARTAMAEDEVADASRAARTQRPNEAARMLNEARLHQPLNADYAYRAAEVLMEHSPVFNSQVLELLKDAIGKNPMAVEYHLARARYLMRSEGAMEQVKADFRRAVELNPNDVWIRVEFAEALKAGGSAGDRAEAVAQYEEAIRRWGLLKEEEPKKRLFAPRVGEIREEVERLKGMK
jgi:tetratricopeptide (TPR) repeat protein